MAAALMPVSDIHAAPDRLAAFNGLVDEVFGLSFDAWDEAGFWDPRYTPLTTFEGDAALANVSLYSLDMVIRDRPCRVAQICTCVTREDRRGQGLGGALLSQTLKEARASHDLVFVMSTGRAVPFYRRHGFVPVLEQVPSLIAPRRRPRPGAIRLDTEDPCVLAQIAERAAARAPVSGLCGVLSPHLLMFHVLYVLPNCVFHIPDLDCLVLARRRGRRLRIFDIVAREMPRFDDLHPYLTEGRRDLVEFAFLPDRLGVQGLRWRRSRANNLHVLHGGRVACDLRRVLIPFTAQA